MGALGAYPNSCGDLIILVDGRPHALLVKSARRLSLHAYGSELGAIETSDCVIGVLCEALRECAEALECERSRHEMYIGRDAEDVGARSALLAADAALRLAHAELNSHQREEPRP